MGSCRKVSGVMGVAVVVCLMASGVSGVSVCHLVLWFNCRRVSGVMCTFRWLCEQKT